MTLLAPTQKRESEKLFLSLLSSPSIHIQIRRHKHNKTRRGAILTFPGPPVRPPRPRPAIFFAFMMPTAKQTSVRPNHDLLTAAREQSYVGFTFTFTCSIARSLPNISTISCAATATFRRPSRHSVAAGRRSNRTDGGF